MVHFIIGRYFLVIRSGMINVEAEKLTMFADDKVYFSDVYKVLKLLAVYKEFSIIIVIDLEAEDQYFSSKDPLECLIRDNTYEDAED